MAWGLMWCDSTVSLSERVRDAALRFREKYGEKPNTCFVLSDEVKDPIMVEGLEIVLTENLPEHHVWVGIAS